MDKYATHLEALVKHTLETADYPILELGCGDYSTPVLAAIANAQGRRMLVQASDESWAARYRDISGVEIEIVKWPEWKAPDPGYFGKWGVVLLDSEESTAGRLRLLPKLLGKADVVLLHDANYAMTRSHWGECVKGYSIEWFKRFDPHTAVLRPC